MSYFKKLNKVSDYRSDFPMLSQRMHGKPLIYFDSAATAQKPQVVIDSMTHFYEKGYGTVHRAIYEIAAHSSHLYHAARLKAMQFLNAKRPEEIIFTRGTTESINLVAYSFGKAFIHPGDEIIISEIEHHSNIVPWQMLCEDRGAILKVIPVNDQGELILEAYQKLLTERTKLVAVAHISNALGTLHPIKKIIQLAHEAGAKVLIDGAQAAPHVPVDVQDLEADFYVFSGHKTYGPTGIGILYGKEVLLEKMPPYLGGGDMIDNVTLTKTTYNTLPLKFEAGTPMIAEVIGLGAALDYLTAIGREEIQAWEHELLLYATQLWTEIPGFKVIGTAPQKGAIISFIMEGIHPLDIGTMLDLKGMAIRTGHHCAQPAMKRFHLPGTARASFGLYNTKEEIEAFAEALQEIAVLFR
ncbi:cysteine desulfurase [Parachlamydia sp. AcF125]|uniref:aminotransferase class V-fold PLP-dependent enzyme n=1 Tax=Parachlamydia sp. AcF125 TaxID=2795736 RepID=UPI001BC9E2B7|nr:cysteine desulfurase [Parachlamydia sp. AcF125]MBS4168075.1 putative cysteine desulfurase [Parachlamydia sp. AcF125]